MGKLSEKDRGIIIKETISDVHNIDILGYLRKTNNNGYMFEIDDRKFNIDLKWEKEDDLDSSTKITVYSLLFITIYMILFNRKYLLISMLISMSVLYTMYLDGSLVRFRDSFKTKLDREYKVILNEILNKYLDVIENYLEENPNTSKDKLLKVSLSNYIDIKYIIVGEDDILKRLVEKIILVNPKIKLKNIVTRDNADVIVRRLPDEVPELIIKRKDIVVDYTIDNGTFCMGQVDDKSKIVSIDVNDYMNPIILDDGGVSVFIE